MPLVEKRCILLGDIFMAIIVIKHRGNFEKTERFFKRMLDFEVEEVLAKYGEKGVAALSAATPINTGKTSSSWFYEIEKTGGGYNIVWSNSNVNDGVNIAAIIQFGHGTGNGGYVSGVDYINPSLEPVFKELAEEAWREVTRL